MKRAAEKQLRREDEDADDNDDVQEVSGSGFKKANESVLAGRQIRGLPRRSLASPGASAASPSTGEESAPDSRSLGFAGFGAASSTSFSFGASQPPGAPKLTPAVPAASPFPSASTATPQSSSLFGPSVSSSASPATKAFAHIVSSSSAPSAAADDDMSEIEYFKAIRGLNVSFLSAVSKAIESDPFVDVAELLERYKSLRVSVKSDYGGKAKTTSSTTAPTAPKAPDVPKLPSVAMPAPPTSFAGFKPTSTGSSSTSLSGGFAPKIDSSGSSSLGSPFSLASSKPAESTASEAPKSAFSFGVPSSSPSSSTFAPSSGFSFGVPPPSSTAPPTSGSESSFKFGAPSGGSLFSKPAGTTSSPSSFSFMGSAPASTSGSLFGTTPSSAFGGSTFGSKDAEKEKDKDSSSKPPAPTSFFSSASSTNPFGLGSSSSTTTVGATTPEKDKSATGTSFAFGSASPGGKPSFFSSGFGAAKAGSIGNPVGFGFGSPPKTPDAESASGPMKSLPFTFGALPKAADDKKDGETVKTEESESGGTVPGVGASAIASGDQPPPMLLAGSSVHDAEGEGEQDEETVHSIRCKVYKMTKDKEGKAQWSEMGVGVLRLKKHKETDARRVLLRNSSTGKITINFRLHSGMNPTVADKVVSFMGHDEGVSVPYRIRMKTVDQAKELKTALDREIEFVKGKSD
ncbi:hypothetical protein C8Q80DRAFT_1185827 [Daedaleopsis nitida]|nr:hypothetical protein C8Q80DRAFT_1185827 [Daedaleopsis nitida]